MTSWKFGDTDLDSFGRITLINDYLNVADQRGDNVLVPFRHGKIWTRKYYDERVLLFGITVIADNAGDLEGTFDEMKSLFSAGAQKTLEMTMENSEKRSALAEVRRNMAVERVSNKIARCTVEFSLADPFFRGDTEIPDNETTINASPKTMIINNSGNTEECNPIIILTGPLSNTVITNTTNGCVLSYNGTITSPRIVTIRTHASGQYMATNDLDENVIANVSHSGASAMMVFTPGDNELIVTDDTATGGKVKITFYPPYL